MIRRFISVRYRSGPEGSPRYRLALQCMAVVGPRSRIVVAHRQGIGEDSANGGIGPELLKGHAQRVAGSGGSVSGTGAGALGAGEIAYADARGPRHRHERPSAIAMPRAATNTVSAHQRRLLPECWGRSEVSKPSAHNWRRGERIVACPCDLLEIDGRVEAAEVIGCPLHAVDR